MTTKYDINTRQGRARRRANKGQFNPSTLQPHSAKFVAEMKKQKAAEKAARKNKKGVM